MVDSVVARMFPEKDRAIVFIIDPIAEVAVPNRVVIVGITREFVVIDGCGGRSAKIGPVINGHAYPNSNPAKTGADIYLGVGIRGEKGSGNDGGKDK